MAMMHCGCIMPAKRRESDNIPAEIGHVTRLRTLRSEFSDHLLRARRDDS